MNQYECLKDNVNLLPRFIQEKHRGE